MSASGPSAQERPPRADERVEVAVIGAGLAGLATAIHLRRGGRRVLCVEPRDWPRPVVGESLDFSTVALLADLDIPVHSLLDADAAFDKRAIELVGPDARRASLWPPDWFARPPIWCSMVAFHVDRAILDARAQQIAAREGVQIRRSRVNAVHADGDVVRSVETEDGRVIEARWFVDASGRSARVLGRRFNLERTEFGPRKVSLWTRFETPPERDSTVFYIEDPAGEYLEWVWEIPLSTREISVGCVLAAGTVSRLRRDGLTPRSILEQRLRPFDRLRPLPAAQPDVTVHATSFTPYCHRRPIGPNWILVGDAAALTDPLTSNGVTAALRHAAMAGPLIAHELAREEPSTARRWIYRHTVNDLATELNTGIEKLVYQHPVRRRLGLRTAVTLYASVGIVTNSLYSKLHPTTLSRSICLSALSGLGRGWAHGWHALAGLQARPPRHTTPSPHEPSPRPRSASTPASPADSRTSSP